MSVATLLLLAPFDVPDAFDELADALGAVSCPWPRASSAMLADQEIAGLPVARRIAGEARPGLVIGMDSSASLAAVIARESAARLVVFDPMPVLPGTVGERQAAEALGDVFRQVDLDQLLAEMQVAEAAGASEQVRGDIYLAFLERDVLPLIEDPHTHRQAVSRLRVQRRDGVVETTASSGLPRWHETIAESGPDADCVVVLTSAGAKANDWAARYRELGIPEVRELPMPNAWWWSCPARAEEMIRAQQ